MSEAREDAQSKETEKKIFPPCNSEWSADKGECFSIVKLCIVILNTFEFSAIKVDSKFKENGTSQSTSNLK